MKFAAGLTVSGILGFVLYEVLKLIVPPLASWGLGVLLLVLKILLILVALAVGACVLGIVVFLVKRMKRTRAEA
jgi:hypothetical protein